MNITAIKRGFVFQFIDAVNSKGEFDKTASSGGILLQGTFDDSAKEPRWVKVISAGSDCKEIKKGDQVMLPALRWTPASTLDGEKIWKSDESEAALVSDEYGVRAIASYVIFKPIKPEVKKQSGLLIVVGNNTDTPRGEVHAVGPDADQDLVDSFIYYNDTNFFETFTSAGVEYAFIKEENILAYKPK